MIIIHHLVQKMLLPCLFSKCRVSYSLFDIGIILLRSCDVFVCLLVGLCTNM